MIERIFAWIGFAAVAVPALVGLLVAARVIGFRGSKFKLEIVDEDDEEKPK